MYVTIHVGAHRGPMNVLTQLLDMLISTLVIKSVSWSVVVLNQRSFEACKLAYIQTGMGGEKGPNIMEQGIGLALQARYSPSGQGIQMKGYTHSAIQIFRQKGIHIYQRHNARKT